MKKAVFIIGLMLSGNVFAGPYTDAIDRQKICDNDSMAGAKGYLARASHKSISYIDSSLGAAPSDIKSVRYQSWAEIREDAYYGYRGGSVC